MTQAKTRETRADHKRTNTSFESPSSESGLAFACLVLRGIPDFLLLERGQSYSVGRAKDCDLPIPNDSVSRRHCFFDYDEELGWRVWESGSTPTTNHTLVDDHELTPGVARPLRDRSVLRIGSEVHADFYTEQGGVAGGVPLMVLDRTTGVLKRDTFVHELDRRIRRHTIDSSCWLLSVDLDGYRTLAAQEGPLRASSALRSAADAVRVWAKSHGVSALNLGNNEDTFYLVLEGCEHAGAAAALAALRSRVAMSLEGEAGLGATVSGGMVALDGVRHAYEAIAAVERRLLQAKLAGGQRIVTSQVDPFWDRKNLDAWRGRLERMASVAIAWPRGFRTTIDSGDRARSALAAMVETLPAGTSVAIAWSGEYWFVAADVSVEALKTALGGVSELEAAVGTGGAKAAGWVDQRLQELRSRAPRGSEHLDYVFASMLDELGAVAVHDRFLRAQQMFEAGLRYLTAMITATVASDLLDEQFQRDFTRRGYANQLGRAIGRPVHGAGSWLLASESLMSLGTPSIPASLRHLMESGWPRHARGALERRNKLVHDHAATVERRADEAELIGAQLRRLAQAFATEHMRLWYVDSATPVRARSQSTRVVARRLAGPHRPRREEFEVPTLLVRGTWVEFDGRWVRLSPLIEFRVCPSCSREDVFVAEELLPRERRLTLRAHGHSMDTAPVEDDVEFEKLYAVVDVFSSDDPPTGMWSIDETMNGLISPKK